jgi:dipeptidyl aminopeptidase/acylaminoacyl peptidase
MGTRSIIADDLYRFRWVADPQVSPDGQRIAFVVKTTDRETNEYRTSIWVAPVAGGLGAATQFTADGSAPRWSPDGRTLAFVSARPGPLPAPDEGEDPAKRDKRCGKGKPQIWLMPATGGEAHQVTFAKYGAGSPVWSPDSAKVLYTATTGDLPETPEHDGKREPRSHRITAFMYRFNGRGYINEQRSHLFVISATGGAATQLTDGDWNDSEAAWSPDGMRIAFSSDREEDRWRIPHGAIWLMNADGSDQHAALLDPDMDYGNPSWSPDGASLAALGGPRWGSGGHVDVYVSSIGSNTARCLTTTHFESFADAIGTDMRNDHADPTPVWSNDGQSLFVLGNARGAGNVYQLSVADGALTAVTTGQHHVLGYSFDQSQNTVALASADVFQPGDIFVHWRDSNDTMCLTDLNHDLLEEVHVSIPETITFTGADGWEIEGWVLKPADFDASKKYPMILEVHGGPNTCYGYSFIHEFQILAGQGYVVLYTNPRGSTSYGRDFSKAVRGHWGEGDYDDIMAGVEAVLARGYVDPDRVGITGGSYGGFMTNWAIGHTTRFKAAVTQRSVTSLVSKFGTSDIGPWMALDNWDGTPWEQPDRYAFHSPISYVQNIQTPLLIIHSDEDWRCPIEQAEQLFTALIWLRREVEFLRFEQQNHDLSRNGHPRLRVERLEAIREWFVRHMPATTSSATEHAEAHHNGAKSAADVAETLRRD